MWMPLYTSWQVVVTGSMKAWYRYVVWGELERVEKADGERTSPKELRG